METAPHVRFRSYALFIAAFAALSVLTGHPAEGSRLLLGLLILAFHGEAVLSWASPAGPADESRRPGVGLWRPFLSIAVGQWVLLTLFAACSALGHALALEQLTLIPFLLLPFGSAVVIARDRFRRAALGTRSGASPAPAFLSRETLLDLLGMALLLFPILHIAAVKFGQWQLPSSDPDIHALHARLSALAGGFFFEIPRSDVPVTYPQGFALLNGLWLKLTGLNPLHVVGIQPYLQYGIGFGLLWSTLASRFEGMPGRRTAFIFVAVLLLNIVAHPVLPVDRALMEGTSRLAHFGLVLQTVILLADSLRRRGDVVLGTLLAALCCAWTVSFNPAHVPMTGVLILLAGVPLLVRHRHRAVLALACGALVFALVQGMHLWTDPYLSVKFLGRGQVYYPNINAFNSGVSKMEPAFRFPGADAVASHLASLPGDVALLWKRTTPDKGADLGFFITLALGLGLLGLALTSREPGRRRRVLLETLLPPVICALLYLFPWALAVATNPASLDGALFAKYAEAYSRQWIVLLVGVWMLLVWSESWSRARATLRRPGRAIAGVVVVMLALYFPFVRANAKWLGNQLQASSLAHTGPEDIRLIDWIRTRLHPDDRILLLGMYWGVPRDQQDTPDGMKKESWIFPMGVARALPILTDQATAFFYMIDGREFTAYAYRDHVLGGLDLAWVDRQGLKWILGLKEAAPAGIAAGFRPCVQSGLAALWVRSTEWETWGTRCEAGLTSGSR